MNWIKTQNSKVIESKTIPVLNITELRKELIEQSKNGLRVIAFFNDNADRLYAVLAADQNKELWISSVVFSGTERAYPSLTRELPALQLFERELFEETGIVPKDHPWLKPVRRNLAAYPFFAMTGEEIHEVAVGPVHAGIIEPGHFRFQCHGEKIYHLEIQLGYQHRGVEKLFLQGDALKKHTLAETIAGDTLIGHNLTYVQAMEALTGLTVAPQAERIRTIALELERAAMHIGNLSALAGDIAYQMGSAVFGATRTLLINSLLTICGSRFGKGLIRVGGVVFDIDPDLRAELKKILNDALLKIKLMGDKMFSSPDVLSRLEYTGIIDKLKANQLGLVGLAARASGIPLDVRSDHPVGLYQEQAVAKVMLERGDVYSRAYLRYQESKQSLLFILEQLDKLTDQPLELVAPGKIKENSCVVSLTEGCRGEIVHVALTDAFGKLQKYKVKDPSFNNWFGLAKAVRNNGISDFPLCNKSFDLSYCGHDL